MELKEISKTLVEAMEIMARLVGKIERESDKEEQCRRQFIVLKGGRAERTTDEHTRER